MAYQGAEAVRLADVERARRQDVRREFDVVEGDGIDREVRRGVSHGFVAVVGTVVCGIALFVALGACRVAITTQTVRCLSANLELRADIEEAELINSDLRIERSVLSSSSRICRIAEQNYGMVHATYHDSICLEAQDELEAAEPEAELDLEGSTTAEGELVQANDAQVEDPASAETTTTGTAADASAQA